MCVERNPPTALRRKGWDHPDQFLEVRSEQGPGDFCIGYRCSACWFVPASQRRTRWPWSVCKNRLATSANHTPADSVRPGWSRSVEPSPELNLLWCPARGVVLKFLQRVEHSFKEPAMLREQEHPQFVNSCRQLTHPHARTLLENRLREFEMFIFRDDAETNKSTPERRNGDSIRQSPTANPR
jgi:hypothetical protein